jgi:hypothetical protein
MTADVTSRALEDAEVLAARLTLVGSAVDEAVQLGTFTDEELAALEDLTTEPVVPSPWFASLREGEKQIAMTAALRGLTARGVYRAQPLDAATGEFRYEVDPDILALLTMRRYVDRLVIAERTTAEGTDWAVLYPQRDGVWLTEYVDRRGLHQFVLAGREVAVPGLATWCGSLAGAPVPEVDVVLTTDEIASGPAVLDPVARSSYATTVTLLDPAGGPRHEEWSGVFGGPEGSCLSTAEGEAVRYRGVDRDGVERHWNDVLEAT